MELQCIQYVCLPHCHLMPLLLVVMAQVRYAACVATRTFLKCVGQEEQHRFLPTLTGPMCLNRWARQAAFGSNS